MSDLSYISAETKGRMEPKHRTTADLVIEVISPGSAIHDRNTKADTYAALGVKELWLVDEIGENIEVRILRGDRYSDGRVFAKGDQLGSVVIQGLMIAVTDVFQD